MEFAICILKARLGGEIRLSDFIMHKGYCSDNFVVSKQSMHVVVYKQIENRAAFCRIVLHVVAVTEI